MKYVSLLIKALITLPVVAYLLFLTLENRSLALHLTWSPFREGTDVPLPIIALVALVAGFIWGCVIFWSNTLTLRAERHLYKKEKAALENRLAIQAAELERLRTLRKENIPASPPPLSPARIAAPDIL